MANIKDPEDGLELIREGLISVATVELPELTAELEFAELGYNSVQTLEFLSYLKEAAGVSLSPRVLMTVETIADLAAVLRSAMADSMRSAS